MENMLKANPAKIGPNDRYDYSESIDSFELDGYEVYAEQYEDSEAIDDINNDKDMEDATYEELSQAYWDTEAIVLQYHRDKEIPEYVLEKATEYFTKTK